MMNVIVSAVRDCFRRAGRRAWTARRPPKPPGTAGKNFRLAAIALVCALFSFSMGHDTASASVHIEGENQSVIEVVIEHEPLAATIETLASKFDVAIEGIGHTAKAEPVTASIQGSFKAVLARLLKNWNHLIVLDPGDPTRVNKIIILNDAQGSRPPAANAPAQPVHPEMP